VTTTKETCPKCGAEVDEDSSTGLITWFKCDSSTRKAIDKFVQSNRCRVTELEKEVERYHDALALVLPMAKGYAHQHPVGSNQKYCDIATALLEKKGTE
jgi:hypothetical protein